MGLPEKLAMVLACLLLPACKSHGTGETRPSHLKTLSEARDMLTQGLFDDALLITDAILSENPSDHAARLVAADGNLGLFRERPSGAAGFLEDAIMNLEKALALTDDDADTWFKIAGCYLKAARFEEGRDAAVKAAAQLGTQNTVPSAIEAAVLVAADNEMQIFVDSRRQEIAAQERPTQETLQLANAVLSRLKWVKAKGSPGEAYRKAARVYMWLDDTNEAIAEMERGIDAEPNHHALHLDYQNIYFDLDRRAECVAAYKRLIARGARFPVLHWYLGRAQVSLGDSYRTGSRWADATAAYVNAAETYREYLAVMPMHRENTSHWIAVCHLSAGRVLIHTNKLEAARAHYEKAYAAYPKVADLDEQGAPMVRDDLGDFYLNGLYQIGRALTVSSTPAALEKSLDHYEWAIAKHPDKYGSIYNNAGLSARDLGVAIEQSAKEPGLTNSERERRTKKAMELWEKSYRYYQKAVLLSPSDPRIVNDCGLMLIYHLHRDHDTAKKLFDRAIAIGQPKIDELPDDADEKLRNDLEEAVGDAWQNIAIMMRNRGKPFEKYKPYLQKAIRYYPYTRREAAKLLNTGGMSDANSQPPTDKQLFEKTAHAAAARADSGDFDGALLILDNKAAELRGHAPFHHLMGRYSLLYANKASAGGGNAGQVDGLYADAIRHLVRAVEIDGAPLETRVLLAQAHHDTGNFKAAAVEAERTLSYIRSVGGSPSQWLLEAHRLRALAGLRNYVAAKQSQGDAPAELQSSRSSFSAIEKLGKLDETMIKNWVMLEQWAGAQALAIGVIARGIQHNPDSQFLLGQLVDMAAEIDSSADAIQALASRRDATGLWYLGKARFNLGQELWFRGRNDQAVVSLDAAIADFASSMTANPDFSSSCTQWQALSMGSKGIAFITAKKFEAAADTLIASARLAPSHINADLGGGYTTKQGILLVVDHYFRERQDLARAEHVLRAATTAVPADPDFANDHGLMARDHGSVLEKAGEKKTAGEMFEASYRSYRRASQLEPGSIRLVNDQALLLIYHLHRDLEQARDLLLASIKRGQEQLASNPPVDESALRDLQEAVGDCHENLGYYHMIHSQDLAAARKAFEKSRTYYPGIARASTLHLIKLTQLEKQARKTESHKKEQSKK